MPIFRDMSNLLKTMPSIDLPKESVEPTPMYEEGPVRKKQVTLVEPTLDGPKKIRRSSRTSKTIGQLRRVPSQCEIKLNELEKPTDIDMVLFDFLSDNGKTVSLSRFTNIIRCTGILDNDPRFRETRANFKEEAARQGHDADNDADVDVDRATFARCINDNIFMVGKVFKNDMVIQEFDHFSSLIESIFDRVAEMPPAGEQCQDFPYLAKTDPNLFGAAVCTIDGQRIFLGDSDKPFTLQDLARVMNYALAVTELGAAEVHRYVGQEPSGRGAGSLSVDSKKRPHNPMINAGGIVMSTLVLRNDKFADRYDHMHKHYAKVVGGDYIQFNNSSFLSARVHADRAFALGYYLRENTCFPEQDKRHLKPDLEFYLQLAATEVTAESASVIAGTLANGGICPITGERLYAPEAVQDTLSLMYSCGLYDHSGQFAFTVGLPAKSSNSGAVIMVIPNLLGLCVYGPAIDHMGNSVKGIRFCEELIRVFNFHNYDNLRHTAQKMDPRKRKVRKNDIKSTDCVVTLLFGASRGDLSIIRKFALGGMDMGRADYDGRTALHLAAAEGHLPVVRILIEQCKVKHDPKDRWNFTPLDDARKFGHPDVLQYLGAFANPKIDRAAIGEIGDQLEASVTLNTETLP